jgi:hypothetical protein
MWQDGGATTLSMMALRMATLSVTIKNMPLSLNNTRHKAMGCYADCSVFDYAVILNTLSVVAPE